MIHEYGRHADPILRALMTGMWWRTESGGGLDRVYADLFRHLPWAGVETRGLLEGPADVAALTEGKIETYSSCHLRGARRLWTFRDRIAALLDAQRIDLVAAHFSLHVAPALDQLAKLPFVMHFHGPWAAEARAEGASPVIAFAKSLVERTVYRRADRVIVLSEAFGKLICGTYGVSEHRIRVVPGSVDLSRFTTAVPKATARRSLGWPTDRPIVVSVRRLTPRMGLDRLIQAMERVAATVPDVLLYIAGTGPLRLDLERKIVELGLERHIKLLGFLPEDNLPLAFRAADLNMVPTVSMEGFGLVAAEALASGTPSLVTPVDGLPDVVKDLSNDLVCASSETDAIADALIDALRGSRSLPDEAACREYAERRFPSGLAAARVASVYRELTSGRDGTRIASEKDRPSAIPPQIQRAVGSGRIDQP